MKTNKWLVVGGTLLGAMMFATVAHAADGDVIDNQGSSNTSITMVGSGGITLYNGAPADFGDLAISSEAQIVNLDPITPILAATGGSGTIKVRDLRGSATGYYVTGYATPMKLNGTETLPVTSFMVNIADESTAIAGVTDPKIVGTGGAIEFLVEPEDAPVILSTNGATAGGLHTTGAISCSLHVGVTESSTAGRYHGQVKYSLMDGQPPQTP
ncbi:hypothetical protein SAMN02745116_00169 [Pilibacter termitis]|uniref:WxL domain surface cell wall-binding n=1 Tax=Pilibacter termitis TaxID=263852 RepID=A0A1T4KBA1_9ENTE|nr:hypothetical protein [Pilibacter termitis]SJZ39710.1 hypothetical protein SAMN02745116_00169 [Pilibacter termitis]